MVPSGEGADAGRRLLSDALADPEVLDDAAVDRAVDLLRSDEKRTRVTAAWVLGLLASDAPAVAADAVPGVADALSDPETRPDAARALAYLGAHDPEAVAAAVADLSDDGATERCREVLSGDGVPTTVVPVDGGGNGEDGSGGGGAAGGGGGADLWGWTGGGGALYDDGSDGGRTGPPTDAPVEPDPVDLALADFEPVAPMARGGAYAVRKALYSPDGADVRAATVTTVRSSPGETFLEAFARRMALWEALSGDCGVLPLVAWGTTPTAWFATEHVLAGGVGGLTRVASFEAVAWTLTRVADALRRAHHSGVIHGGLVPGAVALTPVLTEPRAWAVPRVTHWGVVDLLVGRDGVEASLPPGCLAPEYDAADGLEGVDDATDVFQFGVTAYAALAGRLPFEGSPGGQASTVAPGTSPTPASAYNPAVPGPLDDVLSKCLTARRTRRYGTADALAAELADALEVA